uniref:Uncharacterized protein n=1 Tax=Steinernema glaseri TaxID=37863 RepID=A0A1I8AVY1_9BILA
MSLSRSLKAPLFFHRNRRDVRLILMAPTSCASGNKDLWTHLWTKTMERRRLDGLETHSTGRESQSAKGGGHSVQNFLSGHRISAVVLPSARRVQVDRIGALPRPSARGGTEDEEGFGDEMRLGKPHFYLLCRLPSIIINTVIGHFSTFSSNSDYPEDNIPRLNR